MVDINMENSPSSFDTEQIIANAEEQLKQLAKKRSGFFIKALTYPIRDHKFTWKEGWQGLQFKTPTFYIALAAFGIVFPVGIFLGMLIYTGTLLGAIFLLGLPYAIYDFKQKYKVRINVTEQGLDVNGIHISWALVHQVYIMEYLSWNRRQRSLCIIQADGQLKVYNILGVDEMKMSHAIFKYLQHYRATSVQPS